MNSALWQMLRVWIRLRRGRVPPLSLPDPIWYFAYGSNMNERVVAFLDRVEARE